MTTHPEYELKTEASVVAAAFPHSIRDKVILITGVNAAEEKVRAVIDDIGKGYPQVKCRFLEADLSSQASVRKAGAEVMAYEENINIVINNAGVMALPTRTLNVDGIEMMFGTNHIGHFVLTNMIMPKLVAASKDSEPGSVRIVNVSSFGHLFCPVRLSDWNFTKPASKIPEDEKSNYEMMKVFKLVLDSEDPVYDPWSGYGQSKIANILFSVALNKRLGAHGIQSFALHPGSIDTELTRYIDPEILAKARKSTAAAIPRKNLQQGASTTLVAALDPALKAHGEKMYLSDCQLLDAAPFATDAGKADRLWNLSKEIVKEKFPIS